MRCDVASPAIQPLSTAFGPRSLRRIERKISKVQQEAVEVPVARQGRQSCGTIPSYVQILEPGIILVEREDNLVACDH
jgi:hypothetical protein